MFTVKILFQYICYKSCVQSTTTRLQKYLLHVAIDQCLYRKVRLKMWTFNRNIQINIFSLASRLKKIKKLTCIPWLFFTVLSRWRFIEPTMSTPLPDVNHEILKRELIPSISETATVKRACQLVNQNLFNAHHGKSLPVGSSRVQCWKPLFRRFI